MIEQSALRRPLQHAGLLVLLVVVLVASTISTAVAKPAFVGVASVARRSQGTIGRPCTVIDILRGGGGVVVEEEDDDDDEDEEEEDEEEEDEEEEEEAEIDPSLAKAAMRSSVKAKKKQRKSTKKEMNEKLASNAPAKTYKRKSKGGLLKAIGVPYVIRAFINPFTVFAMTKLYFRSLFDPFYLKQVSVPGRRRPMPQRLPLFGFVLLLSVSFLAICTCTCVGWLSGWLVTTNNNSDSNKILTLMGPGCMNRPIRCC